MSLYQCQLCFNSIFIPIISLYPLNILSIIGKHFHSHFTDKETEKKMFSDLVRGIELAQGTD